MLLTIGAIITGIAALGIIARIIAYLVFAVVRRYLDRLKRRNSATKFIARYRDGDYETVSAGIWSNEQERVTEAASWKAERLDEDLSSINRGEVIFEQ